MFDIRGLFVKDAIIRMLTQLPVIKTPVMDLIFPNRQQAGLALIGADMIKQVARPIAVRRRGAPSIPAGSETGEIAFYEPLPVNPSKFVSAAELNNLKILGVSNQEAWAQQKTDMLRRICRLTTEGICAEALRGTMQWPVQLESGVFETWEIVFGAILTYTLAPATLWSDAGATIALVYTPHTEMQETLQAKGYGGTLEIWAGKNAYQALMVIASKSTTTAKIRVELTDQGINIGGFLIKRRTETNRNPQTGASVPVIATTDVVMIATDAGHDFAYAALDDLDANLQALPFFVKPLKQDDPSGYKLVGMSKPFPIPNTDGICKATVAGA